MKPKQQPSDVGYILINAYREEAAIFRADDKEVAALRLEAQADRMEALALVLRNAND